MAKEDLIIRLSVLQEKARQIEEQINMVNQQIAEMQSLNLNLENIEKTKQKEILAGLGKGIFIKSDIKEKELFVNIGSNIVVKKGFDEVRKIIENQVQGLNEIKQNLLEEINSINFQLQKLIEEAQREK